ncbi:MAG: putative zinc-binding metallopeptidase [Clostridium sp.]|nr:putative zinc-binding metallopeptidase [Clostridium sp.]
MKTKNYIFKSMCALALLAGATSCSEDELGPSIFDTTVSDEPDPTSYTYQFDRWIKENFTDVYNLTFLYKMQDIGTDMDYNLVPAEYGKAVDLAVLTKYLWFDVYKKLAGVDFLKQYGPRVLHLIGSTAVNPVNGTEILGLAEGGLKVSLFRVNLFDPEDFMQLNEKYFKTMHHEFAHILHQTKTYPKEFDLLSIAHYEPTSWQDRNGAEVASFGCTTCYASSQAREDFAETIANYITRTDDQWDLTLWIASKGWRVIEDSSISSFLEGKNLPSMKSYAFSYYYYASAADRTADLRTYVGAFLEYDGVYYMTNLSAKFPGATDVDDATASGTKGGDKFYTTVTETEAYLDDLRSRYDLVAVEDVDKEDGRAIILQKTDIARNWLDTAWGLDLDELRHEVQVRQTSFNLDELRDEVYSIGKEDETATDGDDNATEE